MHAFRRAVLRVVSVFRAGRAEADLAREIDAHLQLLEDQFRGQGLSAREARDAARRAFGGVDQAKERQRDERSFRWLDCWWLDVKLGGRMLVKYPGLTAIGGLGMAVSIAIAAGAFSLVSTLLHGSLPLEEGDRVVALQNWDQAANTPERRALQDFVAWRTELRSVVDLGAFRRVSRNLIAPGQQPTVVRIAEMSASGFRVARVAPLVGRALTDTDERQGAAPVVVIGYDVWQDRFGGDRAIVGRTIRLGDTEHLIVGVMPAAFAFPFNDSLWIPLRVDPARYERRAGPSVTIFGRLAPGVSLAAAQSELSSMGQRAAAACPATHERLRPQVLPYTRPFSDMDDPENALVLRLMQILVTMMLVVVAVNVAMLVYARTATRVGEIGVRSALGASRGRIVGQLFVEALVLAACAALAGVSLAAFALWQLDLTLVQIGLEKPFWLQLGLSRGAMLYVPLLTLLAAAIVGIVPALKATGRQVQAGLRGLSAGGGRMQLGKTWTVLVIAQVAIAAALLPAAIFNAWYSLRHGTADPGFPAGEYMLAGLAMDSPDGSGGESAGEDRAFAALLAARQADLMQRLEADPDVSAVTFAMAAPGMEPTMWLEVEGLATPPHTEAESSGFAVRAGRFGHEARFNRVDIRFFDAFDVPLLMGRTLNAGDTGPAARGVVVNRTFAGGIAGGLDVLGRRVRYVGRSGDARPEDVALDVWYEIVGVVEDFPARPVAIDGMIGAKLYHAAAPGDLHPAGMMFRVKGTPPATLASRLHALAAAVDPNLQLRGLRTLDALLRVDQAIFRQVAAGLALVTLSVVLLSAAGIYALMSFTVAQRRKEIGIRAALGADARLILGGIFSRALAQLGTGAMVGVAIAWLLDRGTGGELMQGQGLVVLPIVAVLLMGVGLLAALGPARRGLRIAPTEALREQ